MVLCRPLSTQHYVQGREGIKEFKPLELMLYTIKHYGCNRRFIQSDKIHTSFITLYYGSKIQYIHAYTYLKTHVH